MNNGVKGSMAGTSLAQGITRLLAPTESAQALMNEFGIEVARNADGGMDLKGTIENLQTAFKSMSKETQVANAKVIFGQTALKGWLPLVSASTEEFDALTEAIYNSAGASDLFMEEVSKSGAYQFKIMKSAIEDFLIVVGDALAPAMKDVAEKVGAFATKLSDWVSKMKETNPELLELIGKIGLLAVVLPPLIMLFGGVVEGLGKIFTGTGSTIGAFTKFAKETKMVASGVKLADGKVGLLAKGLGGLIASLGGTTVAIAGGVLGLGALGIALGENETALSWMQDKWGVFGTVVGGICESLNGWFTLVFGNLAHLLMGVGKSIGAFLTGNWRDIDDIWRETWANMENTTAEAMSNIRMESTNAIKLIRESSEEELAEVEKGFETVYKNISNLTRDNYKDVAQELKGFINNTSDDALAIMKGTSDSMAVLFDNIYSSNTAEQNLKQLEENLKGMATSGKYSAEVLKSEFEKAFNLIQSNAKTSSQQVGEEVTKITRYIGRIAQDGVDNVAKNISGTLKTMDEETFNTMKSLGGTWGTLFKNVEFGSENTATVIVENLKNMGGDTASIIDALNKELQSGFDETGKKIGETSEKIEGSTQTTTEAFANMVETIKNGSEVGLEETATIFAEGLSKLDVETIKTLQGTSDQWYSILSGTVTENGELVENLAQQILWNLGWVSEQSPEKLEGFKTGLLNALVEANLITDGEMQAIVETMQTGSDDMVDAVSGAGADAKEELIPKDSAAAVKEELDAITGAYHEKTQSIADASAKAGEEAQKSFDEKVSQLGKDVKVDSNIINIEELGTQFKNAGTLAITYFVQGWSENNNLITEAINLSLTGVTADLSTHFQTINLNFDGIAEKTGILNDTIARLRDTIAEADAVGFGNLLGNVETVTNKLVVVKNNASEAKNELTNLSQVSTSGVINDLNTVHLNALNVRDSVQKATSELQSFAGKSFGAVTSQMDRFKSSTDKAKDAVLKLIKEIDTLLGKSFTKIQNGIDDTGRKVDSTKSKVSSLKSELQSLNNIGFSSLINELADLRYWLRSVENSAYSASSAVANVKKPSVFERIFGGSGRSIGRSAQDVVSDIYANTTFDISKYQTRGGYYSPNSMASTGAKALEIQSQRDQLDMLKEQNDLLRQLLLATANINGNVNVSVELDGRQVAKGTAKYMETEISTLNKRKSRLGGAF